MKNHPSGFTSRLLSGVAGAALLYLVLPFSSVSEVSASPVVDFEEMRTRDSLPAAGKALNLNTGEPRTVRMIYFLPNDRPFRQEVVDLMKVTIRQVQTFFGDQMEAHGHGRKTFRFETDAQGEPLVHRVDGQYPDSHYQADQCQNAVYFETELAFDLETNVYFIVIDNSAGVFHRGDDLAGGVGGSTSKTGGFALVASGFSWKTVAHELGHGFFLHHDFRDGAFIMSYGPGKERLSACHAEYLAVHPYFNFDIPLEETPLLVTLLNPFSADERILQAYPNGSTNLSLQYQVSDSGGLHQVFLFGVTRDISLAAGAYELIRCRSFAGETETVVTVDYDGDLPSDVVNTNFSDFPAHSLSVLAVDRYGNRGFNRKVFVESSDNILATIKAHVHEARPSERVSESFGISFRGVQSVAFSPNGAMLATGGMFDEKVKVWDAKTRQIIATLDATHEEFQQLGAASVAFSPGEEILAYGAWETNLWHIATQAQFGTFDSVRPFSFSHDGATLATASIGGKADGWHVALWDMKTRQKIATLAGHEGFAESAAFSPDDRMLAVASGEEIKLWDLQTERLVATLAGHETRVHTVAFSPDGTILVSGSPNWIGDEDQPLKLWDAKSGQFVGSIPAGNTSSLAFSPDGAVLAAAQDSGSVGLWDVETRQKTTTLRGHMDRVRQFAFSPDGTTLASGDLSGDVLLWDMSEFVTPVAVIPDANLRAVIREALGKPPFAPITVQDMERLTALDASNRSIRELGGLELATGLTDLNLQGNPLSSAAIAAFIPALQDRGVAVLYDDIPVISTLSKLSGDGQRGPARAALADSLVVSVLDEGGSGVAGVSVRFAVTSGGGILSATTVTTGTDGRAAANLFLGSEPGMNTVVATVAGLDPVTFTATGQRILPATLLEGHTGRVTSVSFSRDSKTLASCSADGTIRLWDVAGGKVEATLEGHTGWVHTVSFSPDGRTLASGGGDNTVRLWDVAGGQEKTILKGHTNWVSSVSFSPDGRTLGSSSVDGTIRLWDVAGGKVEATLEGHTGPVFSVSFSPDGRTLASGSVDGTVLLWDVASGREKATLEGHKSDVLSVSFSPDGRTLASGSRDNTVRLWDVAGGTEKAVLAGHTDEVTSVWFSPDGRTVASSGSWDNTVRLWDVASGEVKAVITGHAESLSFSRDGRTLASGSGDGPILLWDMTPYATPAPTLTKLSGDGQQGAPGDQLADPLVVSVLDEDGNGVAGANITFAVTSGGGTLSTTTVTTGADGRAAATLTLGSKPGANTVTAAAAGLEAVTFTAAGEQVPASLTRVSGDGQQGLTGAQLADPLVVSVLDEDGNGVAGTSITFAVNAGGGTLSATTVTTDADGRAAAVLTLGSAPGANTVTAAAAGLDPVTFTAAAEVSTDFDGDTVTGLSDFFLFADAFGGSDPRFDLDGDGSVGFGDFFLLADRFAEPERGKLLALAREMIGLPDGPQLRQNAPNPFNSGTVISWFLLRPGPARMEVFSLTGQRVAVLREGPEKAGVHRVHWDGRDDRGRPLASGVYLYRLATEESVQTRKLTLLR